MELSRLLATAYCKIDDWTLRKYIIAICKYSHNVLDAEKKVQSKHITLISMRMLIDAACELEAFFLYGNHKVYLDRFFEAKPTNQLKVKGQSLTSSYLRKSLETRYADIDEIYKECCEWIHPSKAVSAGFVIDSDYGIGYTGYFKGNKRVELTADEAREIFNAYIGYRGNKYYSSDNQELEVIRKDYEYVTNMLLEQIERFIKAFSSDETSSMGYGVKF